jgi:hypothetical protein
MVNFNKTLRTITKWFLDVFFNVVFKRSLPQSIDYIELCIYKVIRVIDDPSHENLVLNSTRRHYFDYFNVNVIVCI